MRKTAKLIIWKKFSPIRLSSKPCHIKTSRRMSLIFSPFEWWSVVSVRFAYRQMTLLNIISDITQQRKITTFRWRLGTKLQNTWPRLTYVNLRKSIVLIPECQNWRSSKTDLNASFRNVMVVLPLNRACVSIIMFIRNRFSRILKIGNEQLFRHSLMADIKSKWDHFNANDRYFAIERQADEEDTTQLDVLIQQVLNDCQGRGTRTRFRHVRLDWVYDPGTEQGIRQGDR